MGSIRISSISAKEITFSGLIEKESDELVAMLAGLSWIMIQDGRLVSHQKHLPLPSPTEDEKMLPFWRKHSILEDGYMQEEIFDPERLQRPYAVSIYISSLCAHNYTPENYQQESEKLERWGFVCMRSQRGENGKFWEVWCLPGTWMAKEELQGVVQGAKIQIPFDKKEKEVLKQALEFLRRNVQFGSLDVSIQRLCMVNAD